WAWLPLNAPLAIDAGRLTAKPVVERWSSGFSATVCQPLPATRRWSLTVRPFSERPITTRVQTRPLPSSCTLMSGLTPIVTGRLEPPAQRAWYVVWIRGLAPYVHPPFAPVRTVATRVGAERPYG